MSSPSRRRQPCTPSANRKSVRLRASLVRRETRPAPSLQRHLAGSLTSSLPAFWLEADERSLDSSSRPAALRDRYRTASTGRRLGEWLQASPSPELKAHRKLRCRRVRGPCTSR